jgi:predicted O-methyltransferase YrrM
MEWLRLADHPERVEHIFAVDADDEFAIAFQRFPTVFLKQSGGPVLAWNAAASISKGDVLVQLSDDWKPTKGWDAAILAAIGDVEAPVVLAVNDGHRKDDLLCMAILTRARYKAQGYMFHPEFFSMFSDNWFSHCAFRDGAVIDARDRITFEHVHPIFGKAEMDETYERSNAPYQYQTGEGIFRRLKNGERVSSDMEGWFDFRDVYDYLAATVPNVGKIVEVGAWQGKSICYLRDRLDDLGKSDAETIAVDTFEGDDDTGKRNVFREFMANVGRRKIPIMRTDSIAAAHDFRNESLDGVFIDAAHDYESVKADIEAWRGKVKAGGFFGGHDVDSEGVQRALADCGIKYAVQCRCWIQKDKQPTP